MTVYIVVRTPEPALRPIRVFWRKSEADKVAKDHPAADVVACEVEGVPLVMDEPPSAG